MAIETSAESNMTTDKDKAALVAEVLAMIHRVRIEDPAGFKTFLAPLLVRMGIAQWVH